MTKFTGLQYDRRKLKELIVKHFNSDELESLMFESGYSKGELKGQTLTVKAESLIEYFEHRGELEKLAILLKEKRPNIAWPFYEKATAPTPSQSPHKRDKKSRPSVYVILFGAIIIVIIAIFYINFFPSTGKHSISPNNANCLEEHYKWEVTDNRMNDLIPIEAGKESFFAPQTNSFEWKSSPNVKGYSVVARLICSFPLSGPMNTIIISFDPNPSSSFPFEGDLECRTLVFMTIYEGQQIIGLDSKLPKTEIKFEPDGRELVRLAKSMTDTCGTLTTLSESSYTTEPFFTNTNEITVVIQFVDAWDAYQIRTVFSNLELEIAPN